MCSPTMLAWLNYSWSTGQVSDYRTLAHLAAVYSNCAHEDGLEISRAFYCFLVGRRVVILHAFVKKTEQTPDKEMKLARKRVKELQDG